MNCQLVKDNLLDFADGKLSADLRNTINEHLYSCAECRSYSKWVLEFIKAINIEKSVVANPFLFTRIEEKIRSSKEEHSINFRTRFLRSYYYYAAVIIIALSIGVFSGKQLGTLLNKNVNNTVITSETEQLKQDFYLNELEKDDVSQVLNNQ
jgi:predicted anti-sigma-YlaC factor YlaD